MEARRWRGTGLSEGDSINERFASIGQEARERATLRERGRGRGGGGERRRRRRRRFPRTVPRCARDRLHGSITLFLLPVFRPYVRGLHARRIDFLRTCLRLRARNYVSRARAPLKSQTVANVRREYPPRGFHEAERKRNPATVRLCSTSRRARLRKAAKQHVAQINSRIDHG